MHEAIFVVTYTQEGEFVKAETDAEGQHFVAHARKPERAYAFLLQQISQMYLKEHPAFD